MRPSSAAALLVAGLAAAAGGCLLAAAQDGAGQRQRLDERRALVERLGLTDLALFTEARYTRHPSQADLHSALQDHPGAFDHFPSGSLLAPPPTLTSPDDRLAGKTTSPD